jgi:hypothetical protein
LNLKFSLYNKHFENGMNTGQIPAANYLPRRGGNVDDQEESHHHGLRRKDRFISRISLV